MKTLLLIAALLSLSLATVVPRVTPIHTHEPLVFQVSLDDAPKKRWQPIIKVFAAPLKKFMDYFEQLPISKNFFDEIEYLAKHTYKQHQFVAEVQGLADASGYQFSHLFFLNFMYEYSTVKACTGILVRNEEGKVFHGRNLDFEMWGLLSNLVAKIEFFKGGKKLFTADSVVGSVFVLTGIHHGGFAVNVDTRKENNIFEDLIPVLKNDAMPTCWLLRKVLEEETNYAGALKRLKNDKISAPVYYILSGTGHNEGSVIERDPDYAHAHYELNETNWFLIQTNYDRDYPDPLHDPRRIPVEKKMRERGNHNFTAEVLMNTFMSQWPTFNIATIMTAIINPGQDYHNVTIWYGENPKVSQHQLKAE